jgi:hypothetical protein
MSLIAAAIAIVFAGVTMAQPPQPPSDSAPQLEPAPTGKPKQKLTPEQKQERKAKKQAERKAQKKAARKEARKIIRQSCRAEAKKEGLSGLDLREYVQGCVKMK